MAKVGIAEKTQLKVFISYSRKDEDFAQELLAGLELVGFQPYLDKHDIAAGEDWEVRLGRLIETADTVVFIISPDAVTSERCAWEVDRTITLKIADNVKVEMEKSAITTVLNSDTEK